MKRHSKKATKSFRPERMTEAYEVRAFRDEDEELRFPRADTSILPIVHAEEGALQAVKGAVKGHGEQTIVPVDCQFGDNDICFVES